MRPTGLIRCSAFRTPRPSGVRSIHIAVAFAPCCLIAALAQANAGTPLMWLGLLHLTIINLIIAGIEALILTVVARVAFGRALIASLIANYASALIGLFLLLPLASESLDQVTALPIDAADSHMLRVILLAFLATLVVEGPIFFLITRKRARPRRLVTAFLLAQLATYAALLWIYNDASNASATRLTRDHTMSFVPRGHPATVYYINHADGDLWRVGLDGTGRERIGPIDLFSSPIPDGHTEYARFDPYYHEILTVAATPNGGENLVAVRDLGREQQSQTLIEDLGDSLGPRSSQIHHWDIFDTRPEDLRISHVQLGFTAYEGLRIFPNRTGSDPRLDSWSVAYETPLAAWRITRITVLPGDLIVFELGDRQICVLDPRTRTLGVLAEGRSNLITMPGVRYTDAPPTALPKPERPPP
ncbi:MAG: hypothetical protein KF912_00190 [Phycisphaeraceae bacterium]|nr:hypothetical protein [Phycisphaeraceae bacterium]MBX3365716.1 hypothetical protein [Phycisphaeraceae bacterium]